MQAEWGYARYENQTIGEIKIHFSNGSAYGYPLVMGVNLRDWKRGNAPEAVTTVTSSDIVYSWTGTAPSGQSGGMDLTKVTLPFAYQDLSIVSIDIVDATYQTMGDYDPGVRILAATVEIRSVP